MKQRVPHENGRSMIGWDETLEGGPNATVMSWREVMVVLEAARRTMSS